MRCRPCCSKSVWLHPSPLSLRSPKALHHWQTTQQPTNEAIEMGAMSCQLSWGSKPNIVLEPNLANQTTKLKTTAYSVDAPSTRSWECFVLLVEAALSKIPPTSRAENLPLPHFCLSVFTRGPLCVCVVTSSPPWTSSGRRIPPRLPSGPLELEGIEVVGASSSKPIRLRMPPFLGIGIVNGTRQSAQMVTIF